MSVLCLSALRPCLENDKHLSDNVQSRKEGYVTYLVAVNDVKDGAILSSILSVVDQSDTSDLDLVITLHHSMQAPSKESEEKRKSKGKREI